MVAAAARAATAAANKATLHSLLREVALGTGLGLVTGGIWYAGVYKKEDNLIQKYYAELNGKDASA